MPDLADLSSPFLRERSVDRVAWLPWGPSAHARAAELDRPVLLVVGSEPGDPALLDAFRDPHLSARIAAHFVPIAVDRDERPDVEAVYLHAAVALSGGLAGSPLTLVLTPERMPFLGGVALPIAPTDAQPSLRQVLDRAAEQWAHEPARVLATADRLTRGTARAESLAGLPGADDAVDWLARLAHAAGSDVDPTTGALRGATCGMLAALAEHARRQGDASLRARVVATARRPAVGVGDLVQRVPLWLTLDADLVDLVRGSVPALLAVFDAERTLTVHTALAARALLLAGAALDVPDWVAHGQSRVQALDARMHFEGHLHRVDDDAGVRGPAFLDDHAALTLAHLAVHQVTRDPHHLARAVALAEHTVRRFRDASGSFGYADASAGTHVVAPLRLVSGSEPSGHALLALAALALRDATGDRAWEDVTRDLLRPYAVLARHAPRALGHEAVAWAALHPAAPSQPAPARTGPHGLCVASGHLWVAWTDRHQLSVRPLAQGADGWPTLGAERTVGDAQPGDADGPQPRFRSPRGLDAGGGAVWVADHGNDKLRRIDLATGLTTTAPGAHRLVGTGPSAVLATDDAVLASLTEAHQLWLHAADGRPWVGSGVPGTEDGPAEQASLNGPTALAMSAPWLLWTEAGSGTLRALDLRDRHVRTLIDTELDHPEGLAIADGVAWIADTGHDRVLRVDLADGSRRVALGADVLTAPTALAVWRGFLLVADSGHDRVVALRIQDGEHRPLG